MRAYVYVSWDDKTFSLRGGARRNPLTTFVSSGHQRWVWLRERGNDAEKEARERTLEIHVLPV